MHIKHGRAAQPRADVVPPEAPPRRMVGGVEAIAAVVADVDAADERDLAVDNDGLLVVAMERMLPRIGLAMDPGPAREHVDRVSYLPAGGLECRHGRSSPHEHPNVNPLCGLRQHPAERPGPFA